MTNELAHSLLDTVLEAGRTSSARLAVIGLSKNAGKTTTLNHLVTATAARQLPLGLVSTGRDGEETDAVTDLPKPRIHAPAGTWVATARDAVPAATGRLAVFKQLPHTTPFGPMVVARVEEPGEVLLIGPGSSKRMQEVLGALEAFGARLTIVDGSFDRIAAAAPEVTGTVVLAVGAAYSPSLDQTAAQVRYVLDLFSLPAVPADLLFHAEQVLRQGPVGVVGARHASLPFNSALVEPAQIIRSVEPGETLVLGGALSDRLLAAMLAAGRFPPVIVHDATHILVDRNLWRRFRKRGGTVFVRFPTQLPAITVNPHSPVGASLEPEAFAAAVAEVAGGRPVFDLEAGLRR